MPNTELSDSKIKLYETGPLRAKFKSPRDKKILNSLNLFKITWEKQIREIEDKLKNNEISKEDADKNMEKRLNKIEEVVKQISEYKERYNII